MSFVDLILFFGNRLDHLLHHHGLCQRLPQGAKPGQAIAETKSWWLKELRNLKNRPVLRAAS